MEGNTYLANWKKQGDKFQVYLKDKNDLKGVDIDFETACDELCLNICEVYGDGEAVLSLLRDPPQPSGIAKYARPALVTLSWNDCATGEKYQKELFEGGYCSACHSGIGQRTDSPLKVEAFPKGNIGDFNQFEFSPVLLSEEFLSLLTNNEKNNLGLQEVICTKKTRRKFHEVNGKAVLKQVGVKGGNYSSLSSWQCETCGYKSFSCTHPELPDNYKYMDFCADTDLSNALGDIFVIEDNMGRKMVCLKLNRWKQLIDRAESKGILADRLYVLPDEQIEREPTVRIEPNAN